MKNLSKWILIAGIAVAGAVPVGAQRPSQAETGLVGVNMYDGAFKLLRLFGPPDDILPMGASSATGPAVGGGGGGGGGGNAGGPPPGGGGGGGGAPGPQRARKSDAGGGGFFGPDGGDTPEHILSGGSFTKQEGTGSNPKTGSSDGEVRQTPITARPFFIRWIYKRGGAKYAFLLDRFERVIQIEAIGLENKKVKTRKGMGFGNTYVDLLKTYGTPDSYEIGGNQIIMRYLLKNKVVFRLNRLGVDKPHVVTGIIVAAGKY
ncbi:MAG: hypothetical protein JSS72_09260 [Armatimonadetes bacterium]|nr:hypothetical protein [Armatimonadota bacterium]